MTADASRRSLLVLAVAGLLGATACAQATPHAGPEPVGPDTARGIVQAVGSEPAILVLVPTGGMAAPGLQLHGAATAALRALTGLEVMVAGRRGPATTPAPPMPQGTFMVARFVVRAADGVVATDGIVARVAGRWVLRLADGSTADAPFLPAPLRMQEGVRAYLVGPLSAAPVGYGVIVDPGA